MVLRASSPRMRVICDNDYSGDPDGLWQLAHHARSASVELVTVIGSHLAAGDPFDPSDHVARNAADKAREVLRLADAADVPVVAGSELAITGRTNPRESDATRAIIEAAHADDPRPLYVCCGAGLTEIASAWLLDPTISQGIAAVVWIGGAEYPGVEAPPGAPAIEYNTNIDPLAARVVLEDSDLTVWQVPRAAYRQTLASFAELETLRGTPLTDHLLESLATVEQMCARFGLLIGETYVMGDSPLVLLTALQSSFEPQASSSQSVLQGAPVLNDDGSYSGRFRDDRQVRVFTHLDVSLMLRDLFAKLR